MHRLADEALCNDPDNLVAVLCKAKALAFTRNYADARSLIAEYREKFENDPSGNLLSSVQLVDEQCTNVLNFIALYNSGRAELARIPQGWYTEVLNQHVLNTTQLVEEDTMEVEERSDEVFIVGPEDLLEQFCGYEISVMRKLTSKLDHFPNA